METKKDIVLILGDGGMMGIFVAGVLHALEPLRERIVTVYGTSAGADVGAYFVSGQIDVPRRFFIEHLTKKDFIARNFLRYLLKIFVFPRSRIKDYINVEYVVEVAKDSDCKINLEAFEKSAMEFFVKVIDIATGSPSYLPAKVGVFEKLKATSQCGPLSTKAIEVDGRCYIDGGTIPSSLDARLTAECADKTVIFIQSQGYDFGQKRLLYPLYLLAGHAISLLYGKRLGRAYVQTLFDDPTQELAALPNVRVIKNDLEYSSFCTDKEKLERVYLHGIEKGEALLRNGLL